MEEYENHINQVGFLASLLNMKELYIFVNWLPQLNISLDMFVIGWKDSSATPWIMKAISVSWLSTAV